MESMDIYLEITSERLRQEGLKAAGKFKYTCADTEAPLTLKATVLGEEYGEVCRAILDNDPDALRTELIQLAAVAVAFLESL